MWTLPVKCQVFLCYHLHSPLLCSCAAFAFLLSCVGWWVAGGLLFIFWLVWSKVDSGSNCRQATERPPEYMMVQMPEGMVQGWLVCSTAVFLWMWSQFSHSSCQSKGKLALFLQLVMKIHMEQKRAASAFLGDNLRAFRLPARRGYTGSSVTSLLTTKILV